MPAISFGRKPLATMRRSCMRGGRADSRAHDRRNRVRSGCMNLNFQELQMIRQLISAVALAAAFVAQPSQAAEGVHNVVLVHGAWADGSSWSKVIPLLEKAGLNPIAVQNPLTSFEDDMAATKRAIAQADGPVILVGHSWGGVVITEVGADPKVAGLVYVAAFAPDVGIAVGDLGKGFPEPPGGAELRPD